MHSFSSCSRLYCSCNNLPLVSPRYTDSGYYATIVNVDDRQCSWSAPCYGAERRNSHSYGASHGDSEFLAHVTYTPRRRRQSSTSQRLHTVHPISSPNNPPPLKATEANARRHRIPSGYSLKNWDPSEEPIMLLGSVFDANSLGKWIYDWTVYHHGPATPIADIAGDLWLLLIQLVGRVKCAKECMRCIQESRSRDMVADFIVSGERLAKKLKEILKACETPMLNVSKKNPTQLDKNAGIEFVKSIFGRDRQLETTENFMASIRLWNLRFDANCKDIVNNSNGN